MLPRNHVLQNRYRIIRPLGKGGMGHVYEALDDAVDAIVAIKETFADTDRLRKAFEREAKLLANLRHPVLPRVTHHFFEGDKQFLVMDFIEGDDLYELLRRQRQPFDVEEVLDWADKLLDGLNYLHSRPQPIIHRDIKPANIKLSPDGQLYLLDFGLAKGAAGQMSDADELQSSVLSSVYGYTAAYAPLEQLNNSGTNAQSDIYSLAATLYHLLTGKVPLSASVRYEAIEMGGTEPLAPAHIVNSKIPRPVSEVLSQAMEISRRQRTASAALMRQALHEARRAKEQGEAAAKTELPVTLIINAHEEEEKEQPGGSTLAAPTASSPTVSAPTVRAAAIESAEQKPVAVVENQTMNAPPPQVISHSALEAEASANDSAQVSWPSKIGSETNEASYTSHASETKQQSTGRRIWPLVAVILVLVVGGVIAFVALSSRETATGTTSSNTPGKAITPEPFRPLSFSKNLAGQQGTAWAVAFSPDGNFVASANEDKKIRLWDARTWQLKSEELGLHAAAVNSIAFSPDSKLIASASNDKQVKLWSMEAASAPVNFTAGHSDEIYFVAFSPDGKTIASAGKDKVIRVSNMQSGVTRLAAVLSGHADIIWSLTFSPDGKTLASASKDRTIKLWDTQKWELIQTLSGHTGAVISLAFSPDGAMLASGGDDDTIKLWTIQRVESQTRHEIRTLKGHTDYVTSLSFSSNGQTLASGSNDSTVCLWETQAGSLRQTLTGHKSGVTSVSFSPEGQTLITGSKDGTVKLWQ